MVNPEHSRISSKDKGDRSGSYEVVSQNAELGLGYGIPIHAVNQLKLSKQIAPQPGYLLGQA